MPTVFIPALLRQQAGGLKHIEVEGASVGALIDALEARFPGIKARLVDGARLVPGMAVVVDGEFNPDGLRARISPGSEVHFVPSVRGGGRP